MRHAELRDAVRLALPGHVRLFNNASGMAQHGDKHIVRYGVGAGGSDLIGWTRVKVLPYCPPGRGDPFYISAFTAVELKRENERPTDKQLAFLRAVAAHGGIAAVIRHPNEVADVFQADGTEWLGRVYGESPKR